MSRARLVLEYAYKKATLARSTMHTLESTIRSMDTRVHVYYAFCSMHNIMHTTLLEY